MQVSDLNNQISDANNNLTSKVDWNHNSLQSIEQSISYLLKDRLLMSVANVGLLPTVSRLDSDYCIVNGVGIFKFEEQVTNSNEIYYNALNGGFWSLVLNYKASNYPLTPINSTQVQIITDITQYPTTPTSTQGLKWDGSKWAFECLPKYYNSGAPSNYDSVVFSTGYAGWMKHNPQYILNNTDYSIKEGDETVAFVYAGNSHIKAYLPTLQLSDKGKTFTIVNTTNAAGKQVLVTYNSNTLITIDAAYYSSMTYVRAISGVIMLWNGSNYYIVERF